MNFSGNCLGVETDGALAWVTIDKPPANVITKREIVANGILAIPKYGLRGEHFVVGGSIGFQVLDPIQSRLWIFNVVVQGEGIVSFP